MALLFGNRRFVYYSVLCNLLTNPAVNLLLLLSVRTLGEGSYIVSLVCLEAAALTAEAFVLKPLCRFKITKAFYISAILNASSFSAGILFRLAYSAM